MALNMWKNPDDKGWMWMRGCLRIFERQVLIFPLLVVFLACLSFLFGGHCAAWQWWTAVALVVGMPFLKHAAMLQALLAALLFAGLLLAIKCLLPPVLWDNVSGVDMQVYHLPMIQLLIEGWNPVFDPLAENITANLGLDLWGMAPILVAFLSKTMAVFAAVAYTFVGDPTGLTIPGIAFLWLGVALGAWRQFHGAVRWGVLCALVWLLPCLEGRLFMDLSLGFASCGLLFAMADGLRKGKYDWLRFGVWTTWMATIKLNGVLAVGVFWGLFVGATLWHDWGRRWCWLRRFSLLAVAVAAISSVIIWNPYGTSWRDYGHPLYPFLTVNEQTYPVQDLTWDLRVGNEDYRQMGRVGLWVHEYVSPYMANAFYARKLGKKDFAPQRLGTPANQWVGFRKRVVLWLLFAVLLLHSRGRLWGVGGLLLTGIVPRQAIGFLRYTPWLSALGCLAVALWAESASLRWGQCWNRRIKNGVLLVFCMVGTLWLWHHARDVEFKAREFGCRRKQIHVRFWKTDRKPDKGNEPSDFVARYNYLTCMENHGQLLARELGWSDWVELLPANGWQPTGAALKLANLPLWKWDEREWFSTGRERDERHIEDLGQPWYETSVWDGPMAGIKGKPWLLTPWAYYVPWDTNADHLMEYWIGSEARSGETEAGRLWRRTKGAVRAWGVTYPREGWRWLKGRRR